MTRDIDSLTRLVKFCAMALFLALILVSAAALSPPWMASETQGSWFQRSGAVAVLIAVWVQFKLQSVYTYFDNAAYSIPFDLPKRLNAFYYWVSFANILLSVLGTGIWGYGDLFFLGTE